MKKVAKKSVKKLAVKSSIKSTEQDKFILKVLKTFQKETDKTVTRAVKESTASYTIVLESVRDDFRVVQDQLSHINGRLDGVENRLGSVENRLGGVEERMESLEDETKFIKNYLLDNLEPRLVLVESK